MFAAKPKSKDSSNASAVQQSVSQTATEATSVETSDGVAPTEVDAGDGSESDTSIEDSDEDDDVTGLTEEEEKRRQKEKKERVGIATGFLHYNNNTHNRNNNNSNNNNDIIIVGEHSQIFSAYLLNYLFKLLKLTFVPVHFFGPRDSRRN